MDCAESNMSLESISQKIKELELQNETLRRKYQRLEDFCQKIFLLSKTKLKGKKFNRGIADLRLDVDDSLPFLCGVEDIHTQCLRENLSHMVDDIELKKTHLIDELIEDECLTSDEGSAIRRQTNRQDQTRKLVSLISKRSSKIFSTFLCRMSDKNNYPHIADTLQSCYNEKKRQYHESIHQKSGNKMCAVCALVKRVNIKDVIDILLENYVVDWNIFDRLESSRKPLNEWFYVFECIDRCDDRLMKIQWLQHALSKKHPEIAELFKNGLPKYLRCYCGHGHTRCSTLPSNSDDYSSAGYANTASEGKRKSTSFDVATDTSDLATHSSSIDGSKSETSKLQRTHRINKWLEKADHTYDKEFPDPAIIQDDFSKFSPSIIEEGKRSLANEPNLDTENLEEIAVVYLSKQECSNQIEDRQGISPVRSIRETQDQKPNSTRMRKIQTSQKKVCFLEKHTQERNDELSTCSSVGIQSIITKNEAAALKTKTCKVKDKYLNQMFYSDNAESTRTTQQTKDLEKEHIFLNQQIERGNVLFKVFTDENKIPSSKDCFPTGGAAKETEGASGYEKCQSNQESRKNDKTKRKSGKKKKK